MTDDIDPVDDGPTLDEAKQALDDHAEEPETEAADLPTDVKDGVIPE